MLAFVLLCSSPAATIAQDDDRSGEAVALFNKGQDAHEKGDLLAAVKLYEQALAIINEFPEAELQRGNAFLTLGRVDDAESAFRHAVEMRDDWTIALAALGSVLVQKGRFAEAEPYLVKAVSLDDQNFPAYAASSSSCLRDKSAPPGTRSAATRPFGSFAGSANTLNSMCFTASAMSTSSIATRRSGLSEP